MRYKSADSGIMCPIRTGKKLIRETSVKKIYPVLVHSNMNFSREFQATQAIIERWI
jgi:hypothetical protein